MAPSSSTRRSSAAADKEKERASPIARGGACLNCRRSLLHLASLGPDGNCFVIVYDRVGFTFRRKIKCDGKQPTCTPCQKVEDDYRKWPQTLSSPPQKCLYGPTGTQQPLISVPRASSSQPQAAPHPPPATEGLGGGSSMGKSGSSMGKSASSAGQTPPLSISTSNSPPNSNQNQFSDPSKRQQPSGSAMSIFDLQTPSEHSTSFPFKRPRWSSEQSNDQASSEQAAPLSFLQFPQLSGSNRASLRTGPPPTTHRMKDFSEDYDYVPSSAASGGGLSNSAGPSSSGLSGPVTIWDAMPPVIPSMPSPYIPSYDLLARISEQFFLHSSVASILSREVFFTSLGSLATGKSLERALLHAVLANSSAFINAEDAEASLFDLKEPPSRVHSPGNRTIANAHAQRARGLVDLHREVLADTEEAFLISLLLLSHEVTLECGARAQAEAAWSSVAIRRLAFHDLPILPAGEPSYLLPSISPACTTLWQWQERRSRFWMFFSLDRGIQAMFAWPPFLAEEDVHTTLMVDDSVDRSTGPQPPFRLKELDSFHLKAVAGGSSACSLFKACAIFSRVINFQIRLARSERDGTTSLSRDAIEASDEYQKLAVEAQLTEVASFSSQPPGETDLVDSARFCASVTACSSKIILNELKTDYEVLNSSVESCLSAAQAIASSASKMEANYFNYARCYFQSATAFWIAGKTLLRRLLSNNVENQERFRLKHAFVLLLIALIRYGQFYSRGTFLAKSLLALYRNPWFPATPSLWPPHAICHSLAKSADASGFQFSNLPSLSSPLSPAELQASISDEELERVAITRDV